MIEQVRVQWTETATYSWVFELDIEDGDLQSTGRLHELMDDQGAWDQVTKEGWLGAADLQVNDRTVDQATIVKGE